MYLHVRQRESTACVEPAGSPVFFIYNYFIKVVTTLKKATPHLPTCFEFTEILLILLSSLHNSCICKFTYKIYASKVNL